jgi:predicted nucleotidyltransferase
MLSSRADVEQFLKANSDRLRDYGVARIGLFGSYLRGTQDHDSDIDLLVEFLPGRKSFDNFINLAIFLEDNSGRRVELVTPESLNQHIGPLIRREVEFVELPA